VSFIAAVGTVIAALAPSLFGGDDDAAPSNVDTPSTVSDDVSGTGRPTPRKPATPKLALTTGKGSLYGDPQQIAVFGFSYVIWNAATG